MFDRKQQRGIFILALILLVLLGVRSYVEFTSKEVSLQVEVDTLVQHQLDSLIAIKESKKDTIYPFNPNYLTEYRAYQIGLDNDELSRLERFRESGSYINSVAHFKQVTQVSDAWVDSMSNYFKFPSWVKNQRIAQDRPKAKPSRSLNINKATAQQFQEVYGIGPSISKRIVAEREKLGGFINKEQLKLVYGLKDSTVIRLLERFYVPSVTVNKIALNRASYDELLSIPYLADYQVEELIKERTLREGFTSWDKVVLTRYFPEEKLALIQLYLTLN